MTRNSMQLNRRELLRGGTVLAAMSLFARKQLLAQGTEPLEVASAGAFGPMIDGPLAKAAAQALHLGLHSHAKGADAVAKAIIDGSLRADVFIPITAGPMLSVMRAGKAETAVPIACTEMVIVYSPKSRFTPQFEQAAKGNAHWWEVLQEPGLRFTRSNPSGDPSGRNILFSVMLAAKKYNQPDLVQKVLGDPLNPEQVSIVGNTQERLKSGEVDASASYKVGPGFSGLPYISLPADVNLSGMHVREEHPDVSLLLADRTYYPEPLVFYAAILKGAVSVKGAAAFVTWLQGKEAQALLREHQYDPAGDAPALHA